MTNLLSRFSTPRTTTAAGLPDPFEDLFKGFFVRPVEFPNQPAAPSMRTKARRSPQPSVTHRQTGRPPSVRARRSASMVA